MSKPLALKDPNPALAPAPTEQTADKITTKVQRQVEKMMSTGALTLPEDYHVGNALTSAWLELSKIVNKEGQPVIVNGQINTAVVTTISVVNALQDYVVQGLNCSRKQAYFIVYGNQLTCQRSYHGDMLLATRLEPGIRFQYDTIREGEKARIARENGHIGVVTVVRHEEIEFPRNPKIEGAYCGVYDSLGRCLGYDIMDIGRIKKSWGMSKTYKWSKPDKPSTHDEFPEEMALRTIIRHRCKSIINSTKDSILIEAIQRNAIDTIDAEVEEQALAATSAPVLSLPATPESDPETGEVLEPTGQGQQADF